MTKKLKLPKISKDHLKYSIIGIFVSLLLISAIAGIYSQYIQSSKTLKLIPTSPSSQYALKIDNKNSGFESVSFADRQTSAKGYSLIDKYGVKMTTEYMGTSGQLSVVSGQKDQSEQNVTQQDKENSPQSTVHSSPPQTSTGKNGEAIVTYKDISEGVDLRYTTTKGQVKEEVIINNRNVIDTSEQGTVNSEQNDPKENEKNSSPASPAGGQFTVHSSLSFSFLLKTEGLTYTTNSDGTIDPLFTSIKDKEITYAIPEAYMYDSNGVRSNKVKTVIKKYEKDEKDNKDEKTNIDENVFMITLIPDTSWLTDSKRQFPIIIDPTLVKGAAPVLSLNFDEGTGQTTGDGTGNGNTGTLGTTTGSESTDPSWQKSEGCVSGKCLYFDGSDDRLVVTDNNSIDFASSFTLSMWIKPMEFPGGSNYDTIIDHGNYFELYGTDEIECGFEKVGGGFTEHITPNANLKTNSWQHVACIFDDSANTVKILVNGIEVLSESETNTPITANEDLTLGSYTGGGQYTKTFIDEVRLYGYARTNLQIKQDYVSRGSTMGASTSFASDTNRKLTEGLVGYWKMDETSSPSLDYSGNSNSITWLGNTTFGQGKYGDGNVFDGNDDYALSSNNLELSGDQTYSIWVKPSLLSGDLKGVFTKHNHSTNSNFGINLYNNFRVSIGYQDETREYSDKGTNFNATVGHWTHVVLIYKSDTNRVEFYINGKFDNGWNLTKAVKFTSDKVLLGQWSTSYLGQYEYSGAVDEARLYNRALSEGEVRDLYNYAPGPVAKYSFDNDTSGYAMDSSGNGLNGTWYGTSTRYQTGKFGKAGGFDSTLGSYIEVPDNDLLDLNNLTLSMWVKDVVAPSSGGTSDTGWVDAGTGSNDSSAGTSVWTNPQNIVTSNNVYTIVGTQAALNDSDVRIVKNGVIGSVNKYKNISPTTTDTYNVYGSSSDLWGETLSPTDVNNSNFGFVYQHKVSAVPTYTQYLKATNFGFNVPLSATVLGVETRVEIKLSGSSRDGYVINVDNMQMKVYYSTATPGYLIKKGSDAYNVQVDTSNGITGVLNTTSNATASLTVGDWNHITMVYDGTSQKIYKNGTLQNTTSLTGDINKNTSTLIIGQDVTGYIDDVSIYNYPRTSAQIIEDMNGGHPVGGSPVGSQVGYWKFDEGYGDTTYDWSPQIKNGDLSGSTTCPSATICPTWSNAGKFGKALYFGGLQTANGDSHVRLPNDVYDSLTEGAISLWFKPDDAGDDYQALFGAAEDDNGGLSDIFVVYTRTSTNGVIVASVDNGTPVLQADVSNIPNYTSWHNIVFSVGSSGNELYLDGVKQTLNYSYGSASTNTWFNNISENTTAYTLGCYDPDGSDDNDCWADAALYQGYMDEVKIYSAPLTADQVKTEYLGGVSTKFGSKSTTSAGLADNSASREYCVPGDASTCNPPIGEWKMNEMTGTSAYDTSTSGISGTFGAGGEAPAWISGKIGGALSFDGGDNVNLGDNYDFTGGVSMTLEAWIYPKSTPGSWQRIISKYDTGTAGQWYLSIDSSLHVNFLRECTGYGETSTGTVTLNKWNHVVGVYDGSSYKFYINGVLDTSVVESCNTLPNTTVETMIGAEDDGSGIALPFDGYIDEVRIYDYARSAAQIAWEYNRGAPIAWYKFDECTGVSVSDWSPNANNGYNTNTGTLSLGSLGVTSAGSCTVNANTAWYNGSEGKINASLDFDGSDDYVSVADSDNFSFGNGTSDRPFSVSAWVKMNDATDFPIMNKLGTTSAGSSQEWLFGTGVGDDYLFVQFFDLDSSNWIAVTTSDRLTSLQNQWTHVTMAYDGSGSVSGVTFFVNGQQKSKSSPLSQGSYTSMNNATGLAYIGALWPSDSTYKQFADGQIDDVRVFGYTLTPQQVKDVYNNGAVSFR